MYEVAIVGGGPAGISAAMNLKILNKDFIWFSSRNVSKKVEKSELIKNYPGLPDITGKQLSWAFSNHLESMNITSVEEVVTGIYDTGGKFTLLVKDKEYEAKCVILAIGVEASRTIEGEEEFLGRGVSYCATCDGFLYKGKKIAVLLTDKKYSGEAEYLCDLAEKAYVLPLYRDYKINSPKAEIVLKTPTRLSGDMRLKRVEFKDGFLEVDGMFILRNAISPNVLVHGIGIDGGHIQIKRDCSTNIDGIFAAGDCTGRPYQIAKAIGEGNIAAHSAVEYLNEHK